MLGPQIKYFRKRQKMTQQQLAERAGLKQVLVSRIERGNRKVTVEELKLIASALNVKVSELLEEQAS